MRTVFQVEKVDHLSEHDIYIIGRALDAIEVGSVVFGISKNEVSFFREENVVENRMVDAHSFSRVPTFTVVKIVMYERSVESVARGYTAGIYLHREDQSQSLELKWLAKRD
ncbi:MAG TPA: hypothetical protein VFV38_49935 [Ktedonobacteraceae bacterium]|nr:hypothetical protein [Ktedonobacteraceae bacterium]